MVTGTVHECPEAAAPAAAPWGDIPGHRDIWPTPLQEDLLRAALLADERALAAWHRLRPMLKVEALDSGVQALVPHLRRNLRALGIDDPLLELFKGVHRHTWARNQLMFAQVMPVVAALGTAGVATLMLKGAALVADHRQDAGMRQMSDIDVLVPTPAAAAACHVLVDNGMRPVEDVPLWYVIEYAPSFKHSCNFTDDAGGQLDLHWHALKGSCHSAADEAFWAAAEPVQLRGVCTRALCAADEMLLVILHGLRWSPTPSYRWVLDASLLARGLSGPVDYDRLALQARRHRVAPAVRAALLYLRRIAGVDVPGRALRTLRVVAPLQRLELRAQAQQPRGRSAVGQAAASHNQYVRRSLAPGVRATPATHVRLAGQRMGLDRFGHLPDLRGGGRPGPGRPVAENAAPIGTGVSTPPPLAWGVPLDFSDPGTARDHCLYGLWLPGRLGCWTAGGEARLALTLPEVQHSSLLLELVADTMVEVSARQRLEVLLDNQRVAEVVFDADRPAVDAEHIVLPARLVQGRSRLEIVLRTPDAATPARLGINDDGRSLGVLLRSLSIRPPFRCSPGQRHALGAGTEDEQMLAGGWADADRGGRWTRGSVARMLVQAPTAASVLEWTAQPLTAPGVPPLRVEVSANGAALGTVAYDGAPRCVQLPLGPAGMAGELLLTWRICDPRSPSQLGLSEDRRPLGLFFGSVALLQHLDDDRTQQMNRSAGTATC